MTYVVEDLQAVEPDALLAPSREQGVSVLLHDGLDSMGFNRVSLAAPTLGGLLAFVRDNWGDDSTTGGWYSEFVIGGVYSLAEVDAAVALAQVEIIADIASGIVPQNVRGFSTLHDFVDANEYGGLCDPMTFGGRSNAFAAAVQERLDTWLAAREVEVVKTEHEMALEEIALIADEQVRQIALKMEEGLEAWRSGEFCSPDERDHVIAGCRVLGLTWWEHKPRVEEIADALYEDAGETYNDFASTATFIRDSLLPLVQS